ncbi:anthranilate synthase component I family protein [Herbiconiux sp. P15]|uniref:anthranilate synthase component I family protein n=1 Tax=Herbiconiux liukaitaii TaxID=3342799 RepID=UPI0035B7577C
MPPTLIRRPLAVAADPAEVFQALAGEAENAFWLDSGPAATTGRSYLGVPAAVHPCRTWADLRALLADLGPLSPEPEPLSPQPATLPPEPATLSPEPATLSPEPASLPAAPAGPRFHLGWVGWLSYELGLPDGASVGPDAAMLLRVDRAVEFDHATGEVTLLALPGPDAAAWLDRTEALITSLTLRTTHPPADTGAHPLPVDALAHPSTGAGAGAPVLVARPRHEYRAYADLVDACKATIARGDAYQLCLTNEFRVDVRPDPLSTYLRLRTLSPTHHGGYLKVGERALLSASPEQFLAVTAGGTVSSKPIKGTRPRGAGPVEDALLARELAASAKERAENLMIVDLVRNDLSKVAALGSVAVPVLLEVETYPQVHQLVSTVQATLAEGRTGLDAVEACFPAGSMTGAPKRSAVHRLAELEAAPRGIYSGAFGYFSLDGAVDLAMVIRSIVIDGSGASVGAGGGITALSEPWDEVEETRVKASALLAVLGARSPEPEERPVAKVPESGPRRERANV